MARDYHGDRPLTVHALPATIEILRNHLFNWSIWPDFTQIPTAEAPLLRFESIEVGGEAQLSGGRTVRALPANHVVPAVGYQLDSGDGSLVFTGVDDDPGTLATLARMGFSNPHRVAQTIRSWHHGHIPATRTERGRELFTRLAPRLLEAAHATGAPAPVAEIQCDRVERLTRHDPGWACDRRLSHRDFDTVAICNAKPLRPCGALAHDRRKRTRFRQQRRLGGRPFAGRLIHGHGSSG